MGPTAALSVLVSVIDENEIEVGIIIEFSSSHLPHPQDGESPVRNCTESFVQLVDGKLDRALKTGYSKTRELIEHRFDLNSSSQIVQPNTNEFLGLIAPQGVELGLEIALLS